MKIEVRKAKGAERTVLYKDLEYNEGFRVPPERADVRIKVGANDYVLLADDEVRVCAVQGLIGYALEPVKIKRIIVEVEE